MDDALHRALPQRGLLRRREEAQRDPPDGAARARRRRARRDRLRPRHRRAARRRRRHRRGARGPARASASCSSRTTSGSSSTSPPTSCTSCSTGASSRRAAPSSPSALEQEGFDAFRGRSGGASMSEHARRRPHQGRLPDPRARGPRQAARLPRLGVVVAEAARGARRDGPPLPRPLRQRAPRRVHDRRGDDRGVRGRPRARSPRFLGAADRARSCSPRTSPRRSTSSPTRGPARTCATATRSSLTEMEHHANIVPWHILAAERGVELRWIPLTDDYQLDLTDLDQLLDGAKLLAVTAMSNVLGTINDIRAARRRRARRRRARARRRRAGRPPPAGRRAGLGRRLRRLHRPQDARPDRHRRPVGARPSCSTRCRRSSAAAR